MTTSGGIRASLAGRYASALFDLAREENEIDTVAANLDSLGGALAESDELGDMLASPALSRDEAAKAVAAVAKKAKYHGLTANFLGVLAKAGRLDQLGAVIAAFATLTAEHKGIATATVASARPLTAAQLDALKTKLSARMGRDVTLDATVDPDLLGGLKVQLGSQLIDATVRTKLNTLAQKMAG